MAGQRPAARLLLGSGRRRRRWGARSSPQARRSAPRSPRGSAPADRDVLLRRTAELLPLQRRQKQLQLLELGIPVGQPRLRRRQLGLLPLQHAARSRTTRCSSTGSFGRRARSRRMTCLASARGVGASSKKHNGVRSFDYTAVGVGKSLKTTARRQSRPSMSIASCAGVSADRTLLDLRPDESSPLQPLREQAQAAAVPPQRLQPVATVRFIMPPLVQSPGSRMTLSY